MLFLMHVTRAFAVSSFPFQQHATLSSSSIHHTERVKNALEIKKDFLELSVGVNRLQFFTCLTANTTSR
jgi:hypothetical protein